MRYQYRMVNGPFTATGASRGAGKIPRMTESLKALLEERLEALSLTARKASMKATGKPDLIRNVLRGKSQHLSTPNAKALAPVLKLPLDQLLQYVADGDEAAPGAAPTGRGMTIRELDVRAGAGNSLAVDHIQDGDHIAERVVATWQMPRDVMRGHTSAGEDALRIITVLGDSMEPDLPPGARVMVDTTDRLPTPPGVFVLYDGLGLVVKRVEHLPFSDPSTVRIASDNPRYTPYERTLEEAHIQGRVIGHWRWK